MVIDTSAILALFFNEKHALWVEDHMSRQPGPLLMSTVNLAETLILLKDRQPKLFESLKNEILSSSIRFVPPTPTQAVLATDARGRYPLNLGDCFAYALAKEEDCPLLTLDHDFRKTDIQVILP